MSLKIKEHATMTTEPSEPGSSATAGGASKPLKSCLKKVKQVPQAPYIPSSPLETHLERNEGEEDGLSKRERIQMLIKKKRECDAKAKEILLNLIETNVEKSYLLESAGFINVSHWEDIVIEREISRICGWPLCDNPLGNVPKQQYSIRKNKVLDITERKNFCSPHCYAVSNHFKDQLLISPLWMRDEETIPDFQILEDKSKQLHGINVLMTKLELDLDNVDDEDRRPEMEKDGSDEDGHES